MSILKRVLREDLRPLLRKSSHEDRANESPKARDVDRIIVPSAEARPSVKKTAGIKTVILNWKSGENDPFTVFNATISQHLRACGKNVELIEISEDDWPVRFTRVADGGVEFAFTWQGLGSHAPIGEVGESLWDRLRIPLICVHGDHPCHMPRNHRLESRYCFHLYTNADFARYSNRHFRRLRSASVIDLPQLHRERSLGRRVGDYFVIAKNVYDPFNTERVWREQMERRTFEVYMMAAESLKSRIVREPYVDIHDELDDLIAANDVDWLNPAIDIDAYHLFHSQLDLYLRSHKTISVVMTLHDFPIRVYGRGWERVAENAPSGHSFAPARQMSDSQDLYYSRYGLIDVSPSKTLHDRTRRAMVNGTGFLSSANMEDSFNDIGVFDALFFTFRPGELPDKCAAVVSDPEAHSHLAQQFADRYHDRFHFKNFVNRIDYLAKSVNIDRFDR